MYIRNFNPLMLINTKVRLGWEHDDGALKKTKKVILHVCLSTEGFQSYLVGASTVISAAKIHLL